MSRSGISISFLVKSDRKLLTNSVKNLTKVLENYLKKEDYENLLLEQNNPGFWNMENLKKFYDFYLSFWNEKRISKLN